MKRLISVCALSLATLSLTDAAQANGVVVSPTALSAADRTQLNTAIRTARNANPGAFAKLSTVRTLVVRLDAAKRGRYATITPALKALGPQGLMPMLEQLAVSGNGRGALRDSAWLTWRVGLLEAVGALGDSRSIPVLVATLQNTTLEPEVTYAAAEALGRTGTDEAVRQLIALSSRSSIPLTRGMGACRREAMAQHLASRLAAGLGHEEMKATVEALGKVGNAWAWATPSVRSAEGEPTRSIATRALVDVFVRYPGTVREEAAKSLLVVAHPSAAILVAQARRATTQVDTMAALDKLAADLANNPISANP